MAIFRFFNMAAAAILNFEIFEILTVGTLRQAKLRHLAKFCGDGSNRCVLWRYDDLSLFQYGGRPPSWICCVGDWTTHEGRLVVFITVQNLVSVVSIIYKF